MTVTTKKPKTRSQYKKEEEGKMRQGISGGRITKKTNQSKQTSNREQVNQEVISSIETAHKEKKGWTNIKDAENKLVELEHKYKRAKNEITKVRIRKLIDIYEKQVKSINIKNSKAKKSRDKTPKEMITIDEEEELGCDATVMSDVTVKTANNILQPREGKKK